MAQQPMTAISIPIHQIRPDPQQPRHLLPPDLAEALAGGAAPLDVLAQLRERGKRDKWIGERLAELDGLADSIAADGLIQPIRVFQTAEYSYRIEAGERRWWAHQVLAGRGDTHFETIAAFVIPQAEEHTNVLRRRVAENVFRSDFTAMEIARAMAARKLEIAGAEPGLAGREIERQVGKEYGMSDRRVRQFLALLKLPVEVQELAQQARLGESQLRNLFGIKDPARQLTAAHALVHPVQKRPRRREGPKSVKRSGRESREQRASRIRRGGRKTLDVSRLLGCAKSLQNQNVEAVGRQLKIRIEKDPSERRAIIRLRDALNGGLAESPKL